MTEENFDLWLAHEYRSSSEGRYAENWSDFDRIKSRLASLVTLSISLTTASLAVAFSGHDYASVCLFLSLGFSITAMFCVFGLYSTPLLSKNIGPEGINNTLIDIPERKKIYGIMWLATQTHGINVENAQTLDRDRTWTKRAWITFALTPFLAGVASCIVRLGC